MNPLLDNETRWSSIAADQLLGRKIVKVRYMSAAEQSEMGWYSRPVIMQLDDGNLIWASADEEGNDAGVLFTMNEKQPVLPVLRG